MGIFTSNVTVCIRLDKMALRSGKVWPLVFRASSWVSKNIFTGLSKIIHVRTPPNGWEGDNSEAALPRIKVKSSSFSRRTWDPTAQRMKVAWQFSLLCPKRLIIASYNLRDEIVLAYETSFSVCEKPAARFRSDKDGDVAAQSNRDGRVPQNTTAGKELHPESADIFHKLPTGIIVLLA